MAQIRWTEVDVFPELGHGAQFLRARTLVAWLPGYNWLHEDDPGEIEILVRAQDPAAASREFRNTVEEAVRSKRLDGGPIWENIHVLFNA